MVMGLFSTAPWRRKQKPEAPPAPADQRPDDRFNGWTAYEREREEARMRVISASMDRALGRGRGARNPPVQEYQYCPFDW